VNRDEAKEILLRYRPGTRDAEEPDVRAALELARQDAALAAWLAAHAAFQESARTQFRAVPVPAELKTRILAARQRRQRIIWFRSPALWAAAASIALLLSLAFWWTQPREDLTFTGYRERMVRTVLREYSIQFLSPDLGAIRSYLVAQNVHADYVIPKGLEQVRGYGCSVMSWQNRKVAMVCFEPAAGEQLYLFVAEQVEVPGAPASPSPRFQRVNRLTTAAWTNGGKLYVLAGEGDEAALAKFLKP